MPAIVAAQLAGCATAPPPQTRTDDTVISTRVRSALSTEPTLGTAIVRVSTVGGNVRLTGTADSLSKIKRIGSITRTIGGVRSIQNDVALVATGTGALSTP
ncbi:MAG: BON domain-containing protein [Burkholderiales bacterium]|nr:BON domain-containing protein [Burkholderiales bacterium]